MRRLHSERRLGRISYPHASHKLPRRSSPPRRISAQVFIRTVVPRASTTCPFLTTGLSAHSLDLVRGPRDEDMLNTRMENGRVGVARSTVDMHRVRVRNRASVERPSPGVPTVRPYLCMRIDATRLFGAEIVLGNR
ncbi:hypothetical protein EVAR_62203_1 [Eumeta japonica]|uniref:Uncharacterized protein n=1 Tax=Eumeta variegata TaxID=151549 RepID=A0A4C2A511_EUMVA|nr:hypothetical protein EVAR_62203_1 [Eumeta japonica]